MCSDPALSSATRFEAPSQHFVVLFLFYAKCLTNNMYTNTQYKITRKLKTSFRCLLLHSIINIMIKYRKNKVRLAFCPLKTT